MDYFLEKFNLEKNQKLSFKRERVGRKALKKQEMGCNQLEVKDPGGYIIETVGEDQ